MNPKLFLVLFSALLLSQCREEGNKTSSVIKPGKDMITDMNSYIVRKDRERIQSYFERKGLTMKETTTGLWYFIQKGGTGSFFSDNDVLKYEYECSLLDGTKCYSSVDSGPAEIKLGRSDIPSGLNEGLRLLKPGAEATFILPPHLAYGLIGDGKKIPPRSTLVYTIRILN